MSQSPEELASQIRREVDAICQSLEGSAGWLKAPNGAPSRLTAFQWALVRTPSFKRWFGDWEFPGAPRSRVLDDQGEPLVLHHSTPESFERFEAKNGADSGFHFGTAEQAAQRNPASKAQTIPVFLNIREPARAKDKGSWGRGFASRLKSRRKDGAVYLNRHEGLELGNVLRAIEQGADPDQISPKAFKALFPEAAESWIAIDNEQIRSALTGLSFGLAPSAPAEPPAPPQTTGDRRRFAPGA
jgi:hypothetical protein